jgi:hypothetical protein
MPLEDGSEQESVAAGNAALADELEALNSIYGPDTLVQQTISALATTAVLSLPDSAISFLVSFPTAYPDVPPQILGTQSTGDHSRPGEGEAAVSILRDVLGTIYSPGAVCLFDLVEEGGPLLSGKDEAGHGTEGQAEEHSKERSATPVIENALDDLHIHESPLGSSSDNRAFSAPGAISSSPPPAWTLSESLTVSKSTFIARACPVRSLDEAQDALGHLLAANKKVAAATHNISAWRIKSPAQKSSQGEVPTREVIIQDSDDDGETAAGGRLLHLMQLMDVWNVLVVVTRWYGGVKLGPDRFRCINSVARDALVQGGWGKDGNDEATKTKDKAKSKSKK